MLARLKAPVTPRAYALIATTALVALGLIVLSGAAVRLTGSGLGCPTWPQCNGDALAPSDFHGFVEFGNRLISGFVGLIAIAAGLLAFRRRPYRRDLAMIGLLLPLGVIAQAIIGMFTVKHELSPGFLMAHFLLSIAILVAAVVLTWRAWHEPQDVEPIGDPVAVWAVRALLPLGLLVIVAGAITTSTGPHPGSAGPHQPVHRLDFKGTDTLNWMYHQHGRTGTALLLATLAAILLLWRRGVARQHVRNLAVVAGLLVCQGIVGLLQWELSLPAGLVWVHVTLATATWIALVWAVVAIGSPAVSRTSARASAAPAARVG